MFAGTAAICAAEGAMAGSTGAWGEVGWDREDFNSPYLSIKLHDLRIVNCLVAIELELKLKLKLDRASLTS
jgi:hypothetical protein